MDESPQRSTWQDQQETLSRLQFSARLLKYGGWITDPIKDLGEDLFVRVYEDGVYSGLSFLVQLKSTQGIEEFRIDGDVISYRFAVKDLRHWSASAVPVFLVIWDVTEDKNYGYWINALEAIAWLNQHNEDWSAKDSVQVRIPTANKTDNDGLHRIRDCLANYYLPSMFKEQTLDGEMSFSFPDTPEGIKAAEALQRFFEVGDPVQIDQEFIEAIRFSDWYTRVRGKQDITQITLETTPGKPVPTRIDLITRKGTVISLPYIELRTDRRGVKQVTISNKHQPTAIHIEMVLNLDLTPCPDQVQNVDPNRILLPVDSTKPALAVHFEGNRNQKLNVQDIKDAFAFFEGLSDAIALRLITLSTATSQDFPAPPEKQGTKPDPEFVRLINELCFIQHRVGHALAVDNWIITNEQAQMIDELVEIIKTGRVALRNRVVAVELEKRNLELGLQALLTKQAMTYETHGADSQITILDTTIPLGPATWKVVGIPHMQPDEIKELIGTMEKGETREIDFWILQGTAEYDFWRKRDDIADEQNFET